jgi:hypothetical protein
MDLVEKIVPTVAHSNPFDENDEVDKVVVPVHTNGFDHHRSHTPEETNEKIIIVPQPIEPIVEVKHDQPPTVFQEQDIAKPPPHVHRQQSKHSSVSSVSETDNKNLADSHLSTPSDWIGFDDSPRNTLPPNEPKPVVPVSHVNLFTDSFKTSAISVPPDVDEKEDDPFATERSVDRDRTLSSVLPTNSIDLTHDVDQARSVHSLPDSGRHAHVDTPPAVTQVPRKSLPNLSTPTVIVTANTTDEDSDVRRVPQTTAASVEPKTHMRNHSNPFRSFENLAEAEAELPVNATFERANNSSGEWIVNENSIVHEGEVEIDVDKVPPSPRKQIPIAAVRHSPSTPRKILRAPPPPPTIAEDMSNSDDEVEPIIQQFNRQSTLRKSSIRRVGSTRNSANKQNDSAVKQPMKVIAVHDAKSGS